MKRLLLILAALVSAQAGAVVSSPATEGPLLRLRAGTFDPAAPRARSLTLSHPTEYLIVQFSGPVQAVWRESLARSGAEVYDYLPDYAFVTRMKPDAAMSVSRLPFVRALTPYLPAYRIDPVFARAKGTVRANVSLFPGTDPNAFAAAATSQGLVARAVGRIVAVSGDAEAVRALALEEGVRWIEALPRLRPMIDRARPLIGVNRVWQDLGIYGAGQIVGVFDTGLDTGNPKRLSADFEGKVLAGMGINAEDDWADRIGHGTHVAGIIAGNGLASGSDPEMKKFSRSFAGVAPEAQLVVQEFDIDLCTNRSIGFDYQSDLLPLLKWAYDKGARIHNNSWGDDDVPHGTYSLHAAQMDQFVWENPDFAVFVAAGNEGKDGMSARELAKKMGIDPCKEQTTDPNELMEKLMEYFSKIGELASGDPFGEDGEGDGGDPFEDIFGGGAGGLEDLFGGPGALDAYTEAQELAKGKVEPGSLTSPATAKNVVTVGASESDRPADGGGYTSKTYSEAGFFASPISTDGFSDDPGGIAAFSSRGPTLDGRIKPDLVAPGTNIVSASSPLGDARVYWGKYKELPYAYAGGTSMATPFVSGSAALVREWLQKKQNQPNPSAALIKAILMNGSKDLAPGQYGTGEFQEMEARPNSVEGWGRIDLAATLLPNAHRATLFSDEKAGLATGGNRRFTYRVQPGSPLAVHLVWSDYPGAPSADAALVNDLDLVVTGPDGETLRGNGAEDRLNNAEGVDVKAPLDGNYVVEVRGVNVPHGPQPYALVVSGAATAVTSGTLAGDVNGDGKVTTGDAILVLQAAVGGLTLTAEQTTRADLAPLGQPDGQIAIADAMVVLRAAIGLLTL